MRLRLLVFASMIAGLPSCHSGARVERAARAAAAKHDVPADILLALAYSDSRLRLKGGKRGTWIQMTGRGDTAALERELGLELGTVATDPEASLQAAALALHKKVAGKPPETLDRWRAPLLAWNAQRDAFANAVFVEQVLSLVSTGFRAVDESRREVAVVGRRDPHVALPLPGAPRPTGIVGSSDAYWLEGSLAARRPEIPSQRPIKFIVIHTLEGRFSFNLEWLRKPTTNVGPHYVVSGDGSTVVQVADERAVTFHDACFNEESIGIEHEGYSDDGEAWFTDALYRRSAALVRDIAHRHGVPLDREHILGHGDTSDCSEHTDPGPSWDWNRYFAYLKE